MMSPLNEKSEEVNMTAEDVAEALSLFNEVPSLTSSVLDTVNSVLNQASDEGSSIQKGNSFLDLKNHVLLQYIMNLTYIIHEKLSGKSIENAPAIDRLVELRIVMEKMRPIDEKLKYQINKCVSSSVSGNVDVKDPLQFKANPDNMDNQHDDDDDSSEEKDKSTKVYVPPRISAAHYDEDETVEGRKRKQQESIRKKALSSSMLHELRKEYDTGPEEIKEAIDPYRMKLNEELKERRRYEEEYMTRLPLTKRQKHESRQLTTVSNFSTRFDDIPGLGMQSDDMGRRSIGKKKGKFVKRSAKKKGKRKHH